MDIGTSSRLENGPRETVWGFDFLSYRGNVPERLNGPVWKTGGRASGT